MCVTLICLWPSRNLVGRAIMYTAFDVCTATGIHTLSKHHYHHRTHQTHTPTHVHESWTLRNCMVRNRWTMDRFLAHTQEISLFIRLRILYKFAALMTCLLFFNTNSVTAMLLFFVWPFVFLLAGHFALTIYGYSFFVCWMHWRSLGGFFLFVSTYSWCLWPLFTVHNTIFRNGQSGQHCKKRENHKNDNQPNAEDRENP